MAEQASSRKLATILFSDVVGYSALVGRDEKLAFRLLERQRKLVRTVLPRFAGREVEVIGDAFLVEFDSAQHGVQCALAIQQRLAALAPEQADDPPTLLRIALHLGDIERPGNKVYGDTVNIAARLQDFAPPGGIALSGQVHSQVEGRVALPFHSIGRPVLKNITRSVEIFTVDAAAVQAAPRQDDATSPRNTRPRRLAPALAAAAVLCALIGAAWYFVATRPAPAPVTAAASTPAEDDKSIAVLPLRNASGNASDEYFSDGLSEEIITALAQLQGLRVISRSSSFQFKGRNDDAAAIGAKLHIAYLLDGSVRRERGRVRVVAELVRCADGTATWSQTYDRDSKNILGVQAEIASSVAAQLKIRLVPGAHMSSERPPNDNLAAYDAYLKGNALAVGAGARPKADWQQAIAQYREALRIEPQYALAQAALAQTLIWVTLNYSSAVAGSADLAEARNWAHKALALNPDLADGHAAMGDLYFLMDWKFSDAEKEYRTALRLAPNNKVALDGLQWLLPCLGRPEEALALGHQAIAIDPLFVDHYDVLARNYASAGQLTAAESLLGRRRAQFPDDDNEHDVAMFIAEVSGQPERVLQEARQISGPPLRKAIALAMAYQYGADRAAADGALEELLAKGDKSADGVAEVYAKRGEAAQVFAWLERAYEARDAGLLFMAADPYFKPYRADPRFAALCRKVGLPQCE